MGGSRLGIPIADVFAVVLCAGVALSGNLLELDSFNFFVSMMIGLWADDFEAVEDGALNDLKS